MGIYNEDNERELGDWFSKLPRRYMDLQDFLVELSVNLKMEKSKEYLFHGVMRRLSVLKRCTENIIKIFPVKRTNKLKRDELKDIDINLQTFIFNVFGVLDNLAWVYVLEKELETCINKKNVGLFKDETKKYFSVEFNNYLEEMKSWFFDYLLNFRDSLAHRIPLYVPPMYLSSEETERMKQIDKEKAEAIRKRDFDTAEKLFEEEQNLGALSAHFCHSYTERMTPQNLHGHLISDFRTLEEVIKRYKEMIA